MLEFVHGSIDLNEWRVNFEGGREGKTKACRLRHLTYPLSATFKHMKENAYAFYPYFGRREIFLNAVSIRHNKHSRFLSTVCAHAVEHLLLSDHPRDFAPISAETRRKSSLIRAFLSRFTHSSEDMNSAIYSKYSHRHNEQIYSSVEPTSSSLFEGVRKRSVQTSIRFEPKKRVFNYFFLNFIRGWTH